MHSSHPLCGDQDSRGKPADERPVGSGFKKKKKLLLLNHRIWGKQLTQSVSACLSKSPWTGGGLGNISHHCGVRHTKRMCFSRLVVPAPWYLVSKHGNSLGESLKPQRWARKWHVPFRDLLGVEQWLYTGVGTGQGAGVAAHLFQPGWWLQVGLLLSLIFVLCSFLYLCLIFQ